MAHLRNYQTSLFRAMSNAGRGEFKNSFTNLVSARRGLIVGEVADQINYLADVVSSPDFSIRYYTENKRDCFELTGPHIHYIITNMDFCNGTCSIKDDYHETVGCMEYFDQLISVIENGEIILIIPYERKEKLRNAG